VKALVVVLLALLAAAPLALSQERKPDDAPLVRCVPCKNEGRLPCSKHDKGEMPLEDSVLFCSHVAECAECGGAGWLDCTDCENPRWDGVLEKKRDRSKACKGASDEIDGQMKRKVAKVVTDHFVLVWEVESLKVDKREVKQHELMHLYAERLETLFKDYCDSFGTTSAGFKSRGRVFVWGNQRDQEQGSSHFVGQTSARGTKLMGGTIAFSMCGSKQFVKDDPTLHRTLVHNVVHLLLSHQEPSQWVGNIKGGWVDEGVAHWFEERYFGLCDNYCYEEQNSNVDFKGGKWKPVVRKMVAAGEVAPAAEVMQLNTDGLKLAMHAQSFSYCDYLFALDARKFHQLCRELRKKVAARDAFQKVYGINLLQFDEQWRAWVLATYPVR
jgi:hypothetical protein